MWPTNGIGCLYRNKCTQIQYTKAYVREHPKDDDRAILKNAPNDQMMSLFITIEHSISVVMAAIGTIPRLRGIRYSYQYSGCRMTLCCGHAVKMVVYRTAKAGIRIPQSPSKACELVI